MSYKKKEGGYSGVPNKRGGENNRGGVGNGSI